MPVPAIAVSGAVLAAGAGTRMGSPKGELVVGGIRLVDRAVSALAESGCAQVIAVVRDGVTVDGAVVNTAPERGLRSSLALAVEAATSDVLAVTLADMPAVDAEAVRLVIDGWQPGRVARAAYGAQDGHPIVMSVLDWRAALAVAEPDEGARRYLATRQDRIDRIHLRHSYVDLDSPEDLSAWMSRD